VARLKRPKSGKRSKLRRLEIGRSSFAITQALMPLNWTIVVRFRG